MKKNIIIFSLLLSFQFGAKAQWVTIPDATFAAKLQTLFPSCMNGNQLDTTCAGIVNAATLNLLSVGLMADLTGIQYFDSLKSFKCDGTHLTFLPVLPQYLVRFICTNSQYLTNISALSNLTHIKHIEVWHNNLTSSPTFQNSVEYMDVGHNSITALGNFPISLDTLICDYNQINITSALPSSVVYFTCSHNQLTNIVPLPTNLRDLGCSSNLLSSLPTLPNTIFSLSCGDNPIGNLPTSLPSALSSIDCSNNQLTILPSLPTNLTYLRCSHNQLTNLPSLPYLSPLGTLDCSYNLLTSIPALPMNMGNLTCNNNLLTSLPVLTSLGNLICNDNNITCFPKFPNTLFNANSVNISNNPYTCLPNYVSGMNAVALAHPLCISGNLATNPNNCLGATGMNGNIYIDNNANCTYSSLDSVKKNIHVKLYDNTGALLDNTFSGLTGLYSFTNPVGTYTIKVDTALKPYTVNCPFPGVDSTISLTTSSLLQTNINFPIACKPGFDLGVQGVGTSGIVFPGTYHQLKFVIGDMSNWYNLHCASGVSGQVVITVTGPVSFNNITMGSLMPSVLGNIFTYNIADFGIINSSTAFGLIFSTNTSAVAGDTICVNVTVTPTIGDNNVSNNTFNYCYYVRNSHDPNYKDTYPINVEPGYNNYFTYSIHFQNTGSAAAINIHLQDTLDANLDLNTFQVINYSHYNTTWLTGNKLSFNFPNIQLADSSTDFNGSQGFVQYRIKPLANLPAGTLIHNRASIYFDYNAPVETNTSTNEFMLGVVVPSFIKASSISVFPNPSSGVFRIDAGNNKLKEIKVTDVLGRIVLVANINSSNTTIDLSKEMKGVYFVQLSDENNNRVNKKIIKE